MDAPISVKRFLEQVKARIEAPFAGVCLVGEVSNFRGSGKHWYFTLKEEGASLNCAVWASQQRLLKHSPKDGQRVIVKGSLNLYVAGGTLTLSVTHCELAGVGDLQQRLRELEAGLRAEGIFDRPKRALPKFPKRIGVVAALGGAALQDVLRVTHRRAPGLDILIAPAAAQGERCVPENLHALQALQEPTLGCDLILVVRGGGSLEDLWGFNDPVLVRAVAASRVPVVTGVGHEIDTTLVDLASDLRAATPSQAAELATPDRATLLQALKGRTDRLAFRAQWRLDGLATTLHLLKDSTGMRAVPDRLKELHARLAQLGTRMAGAHPRRRIEVSAARFSALRHRMHQSAIRIGEADRPRLIAAGRHLLPAIEKRLAAQASRLALESERLNGRDPKAPLERGFVLALDGSGKPVVSAAALPKGAILDLRWADGKRKAELAD
ncbi:MAG TPA: exodeoxyribonuclease VII large subunit [Holophagaceae bacterium]|jgi:exodeoxyribonuclease VII large subunit|nr:exodeoxyribonuclease VII large subunit [Holophagaceae bacterium]